MSDVCSLARRVISGDPDAWRDFQNLVEPAIVSIARRHRSMRAKGLSTLPDDVREVTVASLERLARGDFANLRSFLEYSERFDPAASGDHLDDWLYGAVDYVVREHIRKRFGRAPRPQADQASPRPAGKRDLHTFADRLDGPGEERAFLQTMSMTTRLTVAEIFEHIEGAFNATEALAMRMYYAEDRGYDEVALALQLPDEKSAVNLIRRLNARLRYHFASQNEGEPG